jgi:starch phosphorylase
MENQRISSKSHSYWSKSGGVAKGFRPEFGSNPKQSEKMWKLMNTYKANDKETIQKDIINHVEYTLAKTRFDFTSFHCY